MLMKWAILWKAPIVFDSLTLKTASCHWQSSLERFVFCFFVLLFLSVARWRFQSTNKIRFSVNLLREFVWLWETSEKHQHQFNEWRNRNVRIKSRLLSMRKGFIFLTFCHVTCYCVASPYGSNQSKQPNSILESFPHRDVLCSVLDL